MCSRRLVKRKKSEEWKTFLERIEKAYKEDHRQLWQLVNRLVPSGKKAEVAPMRDREGRMAKSEEEIMEVWASHLESLGTQRTHELEDTEFAERVRVHVS